MSAKLRFRAMKSEAITEGHRIRSSSIHTSSRSILRTSVDIEAKTVEIRDRKSTGVYTSYAKGRMPEFDGSSASNSSNALPDED